METKKQNPKMEREAFIRKHFVDGGGLLGRIQKWDEKDGIVRLAIRTVAGSGVCIKPPYLNKLRWVNAYPSRIIIEIER